MEGGRCRRRVEYWEGDLEKDVVRNNMRRYATLKLTELRLV